MTGLFIAVVGPSGVGKDSVMQAMVKARPSLKLARRVITRPADAEGEDFDSVPVSVFRQMQDDGHFAIRWSAHGLSYGIPKSVDADINTNRDVLANLSRGVLEQAQARFSRFRVLSLVADRSVLRQRLLDRGRECPADIEERLQRATYAVPNTVPAVEIDNSGPLELTVQQALNVLYHHQPTGGAQ